MSNFTVIHDKNVVIDSERLKKFVLLAQSAYTHITTKDALLGEQTYYDMIYALKELGYDVSNVEE